MKSGNSAPLGTPKKNFAPPKVKFFIYCPILKKFETNSNVQTIYSPTSRSIFNIIFGNACRQWLNLSFTKNNILKKNIFLFWKKSEFWKPKLLDLSELHFFLIRRDQYTHTIMMVPIFLLCDKHWMFWNTFNFLGGFQRSKLISTNL